jgi:hypothetical protein
MEVVPVSVGEASRAWDEQHLDLTAASGQIRDASTTGFTGPVSGVASRFTTAWERHTRALGGRCEERADGLRAAIHDYVTSDEAEAGALLALASYLAEER